MYTINYEGDVDEEMVVFFVKELNSATGDEDMTIYLSSDGGTMACAEVIIDVISRAAVNRNVTLVANWSVSSCGALIFLESICNKCVLPSAHGVLHELSSYDNSLMMKREDPLHVGLEKSHAKLQESKMKLFRIIGLSEKELSDIKKGKDIYFDAERLREFVANVEAARAENLKDLQKGLIDHFSGETDGDRK